LRLSPIRWVATATVMLLPLASTPSSAADDTIIIGAAIARSGWMAPYDEGPLAAAQMAVDDINKKGGLLGKKLVIQEADTKTEVAGAAQAGAELLDAGAKFLIISCDFDMGGPSALVANQKQVLSFSTCGADAKLGNLAIGRYVFTLATEAESIGALVADWSVHKQGWKSIYLLGDPSFEYTKSLCRGFEAGWTKEAGADTIVGRDSFRNDDASVSAQITRFKSLSKQPDVIALCGVTPGFPMVVKQFRAAGIDVPIVSAVNADGDGWRASVPNNQLTKFFYASYSSARGDDPRPEIKAFNDAFVAKNGKLPSTGQAVTGHSVVTAWARAVERAKSFDSDAVLAELEKFKDEPLYVGLTTFSPQLHITVGRPMLVFDYEQGEPKAVGYYSPTSHDYIKWWN
jgi:branched-chain amino acid transport system substrate-binding protein